MKKKGIVILALIALVCTSVFAQGAKEPATASTAKKVALVMQKGGLGDLGFNDAAYAGLVACKEEYGIDFTAVEAVDSSQGQEIFRGLCDEGYELILNLEAGVSGDMYHVALDYPEVYFCAIGRQLQFNPVDGITTRPANVIESYITLNEHSFLAGIVAAFVATDGNQIVNGIGRNNGCCNIGVLFGADSLGFYQYGDGFKQGVEYLNPNAKVYFDFSVGFSDTANAQTIATNMIKNMNCDVIWTCCGTAGLGGLEATKLNSVYGIGVDTNQDNLQPGNIVTSAIRDNEALVKYYVGEFVKNGKLSQTKFDIFNLANGGVALTDMSTIEKYVTNKAKFEELKKILADTMTWVKEGKIEIFDARLASVEQNGIRFDEWKNTSGKFVTYAELSK